MRTVAGDNNQFALEIYARLRAGRADNLFFAPCSLSIALAMTYTGARGETAEQMARVLHFRLPQERLHPAFDGLRRSWDAAGKESGSRLIVANRLWGQEGFHFLPAFLAVTRDRHGTQLGQVDFARQTETARRRINAWVEEQTHDRIRDLIAPGTLDSSTRLVVTDAIWFQGEWAEPFEREATQVAPFHVSARQQADVPLMSRVDAFRYRAGDGLKALELPYGQGDLTMLVLLPDKIEGLSELEAGLTADNLSRWRSGLRKQEVRAYLPRFRLNSQFRLDNVLKAMGMTRVFTPGEADLSGVSIERDISLSAVIHKASVDVNEEGTEAAAATGIAVKSEKGIGEPPTFRADHPFVFLIRDSRTESILFVGRLVNPRG